MCINRVVTLAPASQFRAFFTVWLAGVRVRERSIFCRVFFVCFHQNHFFFLSPVPPFSLECAVSRATMRGPRANRKHFYKYPFTLATPAVHFILAEDWLKLRRLHNRARRGRTMAHDAPAATNKHTYLQSQRLRSQTPPVHERSGGGHGRGSHQHTHTHAPSAAAAVGSRVSVEHAGGAHELDALGDGLRRAATSQREVP